MKNSSKTATWILGLAMTMIFTQTSIAQPGYSVNFQTFYNELDPYGSWIDYPGYGYVWSPNVGSNFRPYGTNGYWVATEYGNTWVSDYSWGWAPFHYGRWSFDNYLGWLWIPGNEWAPAWVAWRSGGGYYGWAPLGPNVNASILFNNYIPNNYWVFVPQSYVCSFEVSNYYAQPYNTVNIITNTVIINNIHQSHHYFTGPTVHDMSRARGKSVEVYTVNSYNRPGRTLVHNKSVDIYRPQIEHRQDNDRPTHITKHDDNNSRGYDHHDNSDLSQNDHHSNGAFEQTQNKQPYQSRNNDRVNDHSNVRNDQQRQVQILQKDDASVQLQNTDHNRFTEKQNNSTNAQTQHLNEHSNKDLSNLQKGSQESRQRTQQPSQQIEIRESNRQQNSRQQGTVQQTVKPSVDHGHAAVRARSSNERKR